MNKYKVLMIRGNL